ncbi:MAG: hypothetical protein IKC80_10075 [Kiritimatiellae bacterium]|nr:hypothetical protein [Kiritimatiellia bacterium]
MRRLVLVLFSLAAALELGAITATKEYVDKQDAALRANLSGARSVQDLNVYGVKVSHDLDDAALPITWQYGGATYTNAIIDAIVDVGEGVFLSFSAEASGSFGGDSVKVYFDEVGVASSIQMNLSATYFFGGKPYKAGEWPRLKTTAQPTGDTLATSGEIGEVTGYARAVYNYMLGNTNAWFSGTNYPDKATAPNKHRFQFEPGMDLLSVPCSMALWEIRDGVRGGVWDQRDWVSWFWSFKASQMRSEIAATNAAIIAAIPRKAWGTYTASGLENPDPSTVWVDAASTTLAAGFAWQTVANVSGCAYWTIVGNGAVIGNSGTNAVLEIRDFEGKAVMRIVKGENYLAYVDSSSMTGQGRDAQGRVTFDMMANVQPVGEYSTVPETSSFVEESSSGCPVDYEWENLGDGRWRIHFILKPGINSDACFARFKVAVQRGSTIEYTTAPTISGGLIYNGVKIAPVINGDTVTWKVMK